MGIFPKRTAALLVCLVGLTSAGRGAPDDFAGELPVAEPNSPEELYPWTRETGLTERAVPMLEAPDPPDSGYQPLDRYTQPFYSPFSAAPPSFLPGPGPDPSTFRETTVNKPPLGLYPRIFRPGLFEIYPWVGLAESYDSNVNLTPTNKIADFFVTPRFGAEFQLGTPDSQRIAMLDTILGVHGSYEAYADIFSANPGLSAFNQQLDLSARIGRSGAIWRPFVQASDLTGSNLLINEFVNRTERIRVLPGMFASYRLTELIYWNQTFSYLLFDHPDPLYINFNTWDTEQELSYPILNATNGILWAQYRFTQPDRGSSGSEYFLGLGWQGRPEPRLYSQMRIGWDFMDVEGTVPGRNDMSGVRFHGYTTFDWSPRFRIDLKYDREYVFNEAQEDDNYVATLFQLIGDFYLGNNWYLKPYLGLALLDFETSHNLALQSRPELEIDYAFPSPWFTDDSRVFLKVGYNRLDPIKGGGELIDGVRVSVGANLKF